MKIFLHRCIFVVTLLTTNFVYAQTYNYTGSVQNFTVPAGVTQITVDVRGGKGFSNNALSAHGANGGRVEATISVTPGEVLQIYVGQGGSNNYQNAGGWNGGGNGGGASNINSYGGGGGGASDIRRSPYSLSDRLIVASGGGGAGGDRVQNQGPGAGGGGGAGYYGGGGGGGWAWYFTYGGGNGTQTSGGLGGESTSNTLYNGSAGSFGVGGAGGTVPSSSQVATNIGGGAGGAGGGLNGNAGANVAQYVYCGAGGGGGSSYAISTATAVTHTAGFQIGNGQVIITYTVVPLTITGNLNLCVGTNSTLSTADPVFVEPTGGTKTYLGNDIIHRFTSGGTFNTTQSLSARVLVVGGGGGGGSNGGGGGGAGGVYHNLSVGVLSGNTTVTVGGGGAVHGNTASAPTTGGQSAFGTITAGGGGGGSSRDNGTGGAAGGSGTVQGSGGGGSGASGTPRNSAGSGTFAGGNGTTPDQGCNAAGGGGGGAGSAGAAATNNRGGNGGNGVQNDITGTLLWYAGGGGGGTTNYNVGCGTSTGSCNGTACASIINGTGGSTVGGNGEAGSGAANTGSGGGAERIGGSGVVVVRYTAPRWTSSNTGVATVDRYTGVVTPVSAGTSVITYTNASGATASVTVTVAAPAGNPSVFGSNTWNVYGYNGQDVNLGSGTSYVGYYTQNLGSTTNYGFNTQDVANNGWGNGSRPSASTSWQGCPLPSDDYFTFVHKRRGFPCGRYQLTMIDWDDETVVYVNGTQVWQCVSWYGAGGCANQPAANAPAPIGLFDLDANSTIEVRTGEGVGSAQARLDIVPVVNNLSNNGESRTCPVPASSGWQYFTATGSDRLILAVNPNTQNLGNVTAISYVSGSPINIVDCAKPTVAAYDRVSMGRRWRITATTPPAGNVNIRLYFSNTEFSQHQTAANSNTNTVDDIAGLGSLLLTKYSGTNEDGIFGNNTNTCPTGGTFSVHNQAGSGANPFFTNSSYVEFVVPSFSELWLHGSSVANSPLPVELTYFLGKCENGTVNLSWSTASEQNNAFFIIENSKDGETWEFVDRLSGAGNSNNQLTYNSNDSKNKSGDNYYRLSQQDLDGTKEVLASIFVACEKEKENTMLLYPNPASEQVTIDIGAIKNYGASLVRVIDAMGRTIFLDNIEIKEGMQTIFLDVSDYVTGTYFVQLSSSEFVLPTQKLIIRK